MRFLPLTSTWLRCYVASSGHIISLNQRNANEVLLLSTWRDMQSAWRTDYALRLNLPTFPPISKTKCIFHPNSSKMLRFRISGQVGSVRCLDIKR